MKKKHVLINIIVSSILLSGCGNAPKKEVHEYLHVTFLDYDNSVLYHTRTPYGSTVIYRGDTPVRESTFDTVYTFSGWDKDIKEELYDNTVFIATYTNEIRKYLVTFYNYDDTELWHTNVEFGSHATYSSTTPTKDSDDEHIEYEFSGWDKDLSSYVIRGDTSFKATFKTNEYVFATFKNYDNSLINTVKILKGSNAVYTDSTPTKPYGGDDKVYRFSGWDKELDNLTEDTTFVAQFDLLNVYTVTFKNYDDNVLQTVKVVEGDTAVYTNGKPSKPDTSSGDYVTSYTFSGWSSSIENVHSDLTVTAQYTSTTKVTGQTAIKQHLNTYGTGTYHKVTTGPDSNLGYSGSYYYVDYSNNSGGLDSQIAINFTYQNTIGYATFRIYDGITKMYEGNMRAYVSGHYFNRLEMINIVVTKYTTDEQLTLVATLSLLAAQYAIDRASNYLSNNSLPYIW